MPDVISPKKIRQLRLEKGLSQGKMAKACKISTSLVSMIERGERVPSLKTLAGISKAFNVPMSELLNEGLKTELQVLASRYDIEVILQGLKGLIDDLQNKEASISTAGKGPARAKEY